MIIIFSKLIKHFPLFLLFVQLELDFITKATLQFYINSRLSANHNVCVVVCIDKATYNCHLAASEKIPSDLLRMFQSNVSLFYARN